MYRRQQISFKNFVRVLIVSQKCYCQFIPSSTTRIIRNKDAEVDHNLKPTKTDENETDSGKNQCTNNSNEFRVNEVNIQMISRNIYEQLFKSSSRKLDPEVVKSCQDHLIRHGIDYKKAEYMPDIHMELPELKGKDIVEHFYNIGEQQSAPYRKLLEQLAGSALPTPPETWSQAAGWTRYCGDSPPQPVAFPADDALLLDVEVLMSAGKRPTLACAASADAWYGWVSQPVANRSPHQHHDTTNYEDLIPLESDGVSPIDVERPRVVVGHNVCYDRAKVKEQYLLSSSALRFWDTMSMHICVSGVTSYQRAMLKSKEKDGTGNDEDWMDISSLNSLSEVHKLYCGASIDKQTRDVFVEGTMSDVLDNFQAVMRYCASDVQATCRVLRELWPLFQERFPHPVTLAGMLELGSSYLPVNSNWLQYIDSAETVFEDLKLETRQLLSLKADEACRLMLNEQYKTDLWMWDQDWSTQKLKLKKAKVRKTRKKDEECQETPAVQTEAIVKTKECRVPENGFEILNEEFIKHQAKIFKNIETNDSEIEVLNKKFEYLFELGLLLPAKRPYLPGYPAWYRKLCTKPGKDPDWAPGAHNITTSMQITPKLLRLSWEGYPLHHLASDKWGFLVPCTHSRPVTYEPEDEPQIPLKELLEKCPVVESPGLRDGSDDAMEKISKKVEDDMGRRSYYARKKLDEVAAQHNYNGLGVWSGLLLQGCCHFFRLPHKDGPKYKVGNPLAKDFLEMFSQNVLSAQGDAAEKVVNFGRMMSYWRNNRERIAGQQVVWLPPERLPPSLRQETRRYGAILPQVVVAGTLTRRASEPTWMTASNARADRVGSELRAMVQAPPGYKLLGADVDSQELWIASLLGDSTTGLAGGTAFGWSVLAGNKQNNTDLHSLVATAAGISRDHAKVINYARIYGAGQNFAERLLKQFNPTMTNSEAKSKAHKMFTTTKGRRVYRLRKKYMEGLMDEDLEGQSVEMTSYQAQRLARLSGKRVEEMFERPQWLGGTESEMFNKLEEIADQEEPETAFLSAKLSRAVAATTGRWDGTKHNWAVQSAAADFLHLMLVCMRWRVTPHARFCLSFHDEVRYLVPEQHKYEAARALQLTNLLTRAFCAQRAGLPDLPLSVSFFTSVELDSVLRKECAADCETPSNPHGLSRGYGVPAGEPLTVADVLHKRDNTLDAL